MDVRKIRPIQDWVLVLDDPRKLETNGGIILPANETGVEKVTEGSGEVLAFGNGVRTRALHLEKGVRIVYRGFLKHAQKLLDVDEKWPDGQAKIYFLMKSDDILGVVAPGVNVGVFSGRPQVPEKGD